MCLAKNPPSRLINFHTRALFFSNQQFSGPPLDQIKFLPTSAQNYIKQYQVFLLLEKTDKNMNIIKQTLIWSKVWHLIYKVWHGEIFKDCNLFYFYIYLTCLIYQMTNL